MPTDTDQEQFAEQLAQQLKGIDLPGSVSWWPLAIGWWIIIAFSLVTISIVVFKLLKKIQQNKYRKTASAELQDAFKHWQQSDDTLTYLQSSNAILKRVIRKIEQNPNTLSVSKTGNAWSELLQHYASHPIPDKTLSALSFECYQAKPNVDVAQVHGQLKTWLSSHRRLQNA